MGVDTYTKLILGVQLDPAMIKQVLGQPNLTDNQLVELIGCYSDDPDQPDSPNSLLNGDYFLMACGDLYSGNDWYFYLVIKEYGCYYCVGTSITQLQKDIAQINQQWWQEAQEVFQFTDEPQIIATYHLC